MKTGNTLLTAKAQRTRSATVASTVALRVLCAFAVSSPVFQRAMSILCLESGGTKLVAALAGSDGGLIRVSRSLRPIHQNAGQTLDQLIEMGRQLVRQSGSIRAVGFGFGGLVRRSDSRPYVCFHEEGWETIDGYQLLSSAFEVPVFIENDCNLAALGEAHFGFALKKGTLFYATLGTGIGGAIVHDGHLLQLGELGEAEIGHIVVEEDGPACPCGNRGCLETLCSGPGLAMLAKRMSGLDFDAPTLMNAYRQKDHPATEVVCRAAGYLGQVFGSVSNLIQPDIVVLGGGVMQSNEAFLAAIAERAEAYTFPLFRKKDRFRLSRLEENVVCQGAAIYALQNLAP